MKFKLIIFLCFLLGTLLSCGDKPNLVKKTTQEENAKEGNGATAHGVAMPEPAKVEPR